MIQLVRPAEPIPLTTHRARWTQRWEQILRDGGRRDWATQAAKRAIQEPLLIFTWRKCAFCESVVNLTSFLEIEHYYGKVLRPDLAFDWENLFPSCGYCNRSKSDIDHQGRLLKPDVDNPELLLWLDVGTGELQPHPTLNAIQSQRVWETIDAYKLKRGALCNERMEMVKRVNRWLAGAAGQAQASPISKEEWEYLQRPSTPWKFVIRHALVQGGQAQLAELDRQGFLAPP